MPEASLISILVQGGLASVALVALYVIYRMQNGQRTEFMEALKANREHNAEQGRLNRESMEKMAAATLVNARATAKLTTRVVQLSADRRIKRRN